jgi:NitT/TauT family transport system ATP-binding protein
MKLVGFEGFESAYPKELSGGIKKKVDIAHCYAINPTVLLMDELFGSLDVITKELMQMELLRI